MAHKIGLHDTQYEPDICGAVDFCFFDDDNDVERTKSATSEIVRNSVVSSSYHQHISRVQASSSPSPLVGEKCLVESRLLEDTSCGLGGLTLQHQEKEEEETGRKNRRRRRRKRERQPAEGHQESVGEAMRNEGRVSFGSSSSERGTIGSASSFEAHEPQILLHTHPEEASGAVMEHVDQYNPYSTDEWEESDLSATSDEDHSDSSDDDDPKSQVDRLIERGALMYMDGENSNLSSETESSDSSDYDDSDSESDITDVSPLISATASPLGLSPILPRRTLGTSPLALHDNRDLDYHRPDISSNDQGYDSQPQCNGSSHSNSDDSTDMTLLLKAVVELEKKQKRNNYNHQNNKTHNDRYNNRHNHHSSSKSRHHQNNHQTYHHHHHQATTSPLPIHPIDASPHHSHLRKASSRSHRRKNMSFTNDEVRRIDRDNQILLQKIYSVHARSKRQSSSNQNNRPVHRPANSTINRRREDEQIRRENMILLRKIQDAKPSRDVTASRSPQKDNTQRPSTF